MSEGDRSEFSSAPTQVLRPVEVEERHQREIHNSTEPPAQLLDPAALVLTPLVNTLINSSQSGSRQLFSLLSVTSYSSLAFHKLTLLLYNISGVKSFERGAFRRRFCYCVTNDTNDLADFTAVLLDVTGNSTSSLHEVFKSSSILSVSERNNSGCIYICVMAGRTDGAAPELWEVGSITPLFNQTLVEGSANISSIRLPADWNQPPTTRSHASSSAMSSMSTSRVLSTAHASLSQSRTSATTAEVTTSEATTTPQRSTNSTSQHTSMIQRPETTGSWTTQRILTSLTKTTQPETGPAATTAKVTTSEAITTPQHSTTSTSARQSTVRRPETTGSWTTQRLTPPSRTTQPETGPAATTAKVTTSEAITTPQHSTTSTSQHMSMVQRPEMTGSWMTQRISAPLSRTTQPETGPAATTAKVTTSEAITTPQHSTTSTSQHMSMVQRPEMTGSWMTQRISALLSRTTKPETGPAATAAKVTTSEAITTPQHSTTSTSQHMSMVQRPETTGSWTTQRLTLLSRTQPETGPAATTPLSGAAEETTIRTTPEHLNTEHPEAFSPLISSIEPTRHTAPDKKTTPTRTRTTTSESEETEKPGCPWRRAEASGGSMKLGAHKLQPCVLELCRFFSQCLCGAFSHKTRLQSYCDDSHRWYETHTFEVCRRVKRVSFSRNLKQRCLSKMCNQL